MCAISVTLSASELQNTFNGEDLGNTTKRLQSRLKSKLSGLLGRVLGRDPTPLIDLTGAQVQQYTDTYSDHVCSDVLADFHKFLARAGAPQTLGGIPTGWTVFSYPPRGVLPNTMSLASFGEGLAGWFMRTQKGMFSLSRPVQAVPDISFITPTYRYCFVGVKTSLARDRLKSAMLKDAIDILAEIAMAKYHMVTPMPFWVYTVGVHLRSAANADLYALGLEEV